MLNTEVFINKSKVIHGELYDYSSTIYNIASKKVIIICRIHGKFEQLPQSHLQGSGCRKCFFDKLKSNRDEFIKRASIIHNNLYNYTSVVYENQNEKVVIECKKHGNFEQTPIII